MGELDAHYAAGRLSYEDYQHRLAGIQSADVQAQLAPFFRDLPPLVSEGAALDIQRLPVNTYTEVEIADARQRARHTRLGVFTLSVLGGWGLAAATSISLFWLIPATVFVLLYIMKVGPDSWHAPSPRQLAAQRRQNLKMLQSAEIAQRKQARRMQQEELKDSAVQFAQRSIERFNR